MASALYSNLKQKAGGLLRRWPLDQLQQHQRRLKQSPYIEGEIVYSKNNVCVHTEGPVAMETAHHAGYLCIECRGGDFLLKWTPNRRLVVKQAPSPPTGGGDDDDNPRDPPESPASLTSVTSSASSSGGASWTTAASSGGDGEARRRPPTVFHCNLMRMRRLLLAAADVDAADAAGSVDDAGHAVIQSGEWQLKLLHFHRGGLRRLADLLDSRPDAFRRAARRPGYVVYSTAGGAAALASPTSPSPSPLFSGSADVVEAASADAEADSDGRKPLTLATFERDLADADGCVEDVAGFRRAVFLGGVAPDARRLLWPLVVGLYPASATTCQRRLLRTQLEARLADIRRRRLLAATGNGGDFESRVAAPIERDVGRADRDQEFYRGAEGEANTLRLRDLLLDLAFDNADLGYAQAMTELLSPMLLVLDSDAEAYWCFERLVRAGHFFSAPTDAEMDGQLGRLRDLLRLMRPRFYEYCKAIGDPDLLYCHRWMILCFKREFPLDETLRVWEACWSRCATDYFHLFLCLAVIDVYGDFCVEKRLPADEALMYFSQLSGRMEAAPLLARARRLLAGFRVLPALPCALATLCHRCGPGMWDSGHLPTVRCPDGPHVCSYLR